MESKVSNNEILHDNNSYPQIANILCEYHEN